MNQMETRETPVPGKIRNEYFAAPTRRNDAPTMPSTAETRETYWEEEG